jgi:hypothetical protein
MFIRQAFKSTFISKYLYGNLKDSDRIFTNVYKDGDPFIGGALKRVILYQSSGRLVPYKRYPRQWS